MHGVQPPTFFLLFVISPTFSYFSTKFLLFPTFWGKNPTFFHTFCQNSYFFLLFDLSYRWTPCKCSPSLGSIDEGHITWAWRRSLDTDKRPCFRQGPDSKSEPFGRYVSSTFFSPSFHFQHSRPKMDWFAPKQVPWMPDLRTWDIVSSGPTTLVKEIHVRSLAGCTNLDIPKNNLFQWCVTRSAGSNTGHFGQFLQARYLRICKRTYRIAPASEQSQIL